MNAPASDFPEVFRVGDGPLPCIFLVDTTGKPPVKVSVKDFSELFRAVTPPPLRPARVRGLPEIRWACPRGLHRKRLTGEIPRKKGNFPVFGTY